MYNITITRVADLLWEGKAEIEGNDVGPIRIACETEEEAYNYVERTFLPDLRNNQRELSGLVFPWEEEND